MTDNHFDQACRYLLANLDTVGLFAWLLGLDRTAFSFHGWLDTRSIPFPGRPERTGDSVAHIINQQEHGVPWAVPVEFQIVPDSEMPGRYLEYLGRIWREKKPDPHRGSRFCLGPVVVNLTGKGSSSHDSEWDEVGFGTHLRVREINLSEYDADDILTDLESGNATRSLLPWIPLMESGADSKVLDRWVAIASSEPNDHWRAEYGALALVFASATSWNGAWQLKLKGWQAVQSSQVLEWQAERELETRADTVLQILEVKFTTVPQDLEQAIRSTKDIGPLKSWLPMAVRANSIDDFRQAAGL